MKGVIKIFQRLFFFFADEINTAIKKAAHKLHVSRSDYDH